MGKFDGRVFLCGLYMDCALDHLVGLDWCYFLYRYGMLKSNSHEQGEDLSCLVYMVQFQFSKTLSIPFVLLPICVPCKAIEFGPRRFDEREPLLEN
jgi:hypothetical protein